MAVAKINGLKSYLQNVQRHVVGLDYTVIPGETLLLCVETHCLIIQLESLDCVPNTLKQFQAEETISFLGTGMTSIVHRLQERAIQCATGIDVGDLAAVLMKKPNIENYKLAELAGEIGMDIKEPIDEKRDGEWPHRNALCFSKEKIKNAMHEVYTSYVIGNKLLDLQSYFELVSACVKFLIHQIKNLLLHFSLSLMLYVDRRYNTINLT